MARQTSSRLIPSNTHPLRLPGTSWEVNCLQAMQLPLGASENGAVPEGTKDSPPAQLGPPVFLEQVLVTWKCHLLLYLIKLQQ